jgi:hypothetical protein
VLRLVGFAAALFVCSVGLLFVRQRLVPSAVAPETHVMSALRHVLFAFNVMGLKYDGSGIRALIIGWQAVLGLLCVLAVISGPRAFRPAAAVWFLGVFATATPGLNVERVNLLLFPVTCAAFFIAELLAMVLRAFPRRMALGVAALVLAWGIGGSFYVSQVMMQGLHPASYETVKWNAVLVYGEDAPHATIPEQRRQATLAQLAKFGIHSWPEFEQRYPALVNDAIRSGRMAPSDHAALFLTRLPMFER